MATKTKKPLTKKACKSLKKRPALGTKAAAPSPKAKAPKVKRCPDCAAPLGPNGVCDDPTCQVLRLKTEHAAKALPGVVTGTDPSLRGASAKAPVKKTKAAKPATEKKVTCASRAKELILQGKSNKEVFAILQPEFNLPDKHSWYPGWYRHDLRRAGKLPKELDKDYKKPHTIER